MLKAVLALERAGRLSEMEQVRTELVTRYGDEPTTLGGLSGKAADLVRKLTRDGRSVTVDSRPDLAPSRFGPELGGPVEAAWQWRFAESIEAGMVPVEWTQWDTHPLSATVPAASVEGSTLYVNYLGYLFALDLKSGKLLWRTEGLHHLRLITPQDYTRGIDPARFAIVAAGDYVCSLARNLKEPNFVAPFTLTCRRAEGGEVVWHSSDLADYAQLDLVGPPIAVDGRLYVAAKSLANQQQQQRQPQQFVLSIQPHDGKVLWKTEVGTFRQGQQMYNYGYNREPSPQPRLLPRGGALYVDTHVGVLARLDADTGALDWGYGYKTEPYQSSYRFFYYDEPPQTLAEGSAPLLAGETFLVKGMQSSRLYAIDPHRMKALWDRPVTKNTRLLGVSDRALFLGGDELSALDLKTRALLWATRVPGGSLEADVVVRPDGLWQLTSRGIFEIDPETGGVRRIFRGVDLGAAGGDLVLTDDLLLAVSSRSIAAYPRRAGAVRVSRGGDTASGKGRASHE